MSRTSSTLNPIKLYNSKRYKAIELSKSMLSYTTYFFKYEYCSVNTRVNSIMREWKIKEMDHRSMSHPWVNLGHDPM
jgi:hypothetical protein